MFVLGELVLNKCKCISVLLFQETPTEATVGHERLMELRRRIDSVTCPVAVRKYNYRHFKFVTFRPR